MLYSKKGFTLFEIMIVLALIGVFFGITMSMNKDARTYQLSAERLANAIYDIVRTARSNMIIGRGVFSGSTMVVATERTIYLTSTGMISTYRNNTATGAETTFVERYFDNDPLYKISDIAVSSGGIVNGVAPTWDNTGSTISSIAITIASNADLSITGTGSDGSILIPTGKIRTLRITASYLGFEKSVLIDRITGAIELSQGRGMASDGTVIMAPTVIVVAPPTQTNGQCGTANGVSTSTAPSAGLCTAGTPGTVGGTGPWNWNCSGIYGGTLAACNAPLLNPYASCTAVGQTYIATTTYPGCNEADKIICTGTSVGYTWAMCNVGSNTAGTTSASYGSFFQWGRNVPFPTSGSVSIIAGPLSASAASATTNFITTSGMDWLTPQDNNLWGDTTNTSLARKGPCQNGYHVPSYSEMNSMKNALPGSVWMTTLKAPLSGYRHYQDTSIGGSHGFWWTSLGGQYMYGDATNTYLGGNSRGLGFSVRCIKN